MQLERFFGEVSAQSPGGSDLDESGELFQLDQLSEWSGPDKKVPPAWLALRDAAAAALEHSRDLRAVAHLASALLQTEGIQSFCASLQLMRSLLENLWDDIYPRIDGGDAIERSSAVLNLVDFHKFIGPLRLAPLVEVRGVGRFCLLEIEIAQGKRKAPADFKGEPPQEALVMAAFDRVDLDELKQLDAAVTRGSEALEAIKAILTERLGEKAAPDLARLLEPMHAIRTLAGARLAARTGNGAVTSAAEAHAVAQPDALSPSPSPSPLAVAVADGAARSRQDAVRALDGVIQYFRSHEPSSPVPLLLERAMRLIDKDFMEIIEDIAPGGLEQAKTIRGKAAERS
ncbi:MAG: type VI secretion system protein TssA [Nitrococcus sp.]|nr:type VI secretion system protein TssA [Nitrococcus sp.]